MLLPRSLPPDDRCFLFPGLAPGKYTLTAQRRGYLTQSFNQHDQFATSIAVSPSPASDNLVFRLTGESAISGTVIDEQGDPVRDARIVLFQSAVNDGSRGMRQRGTTLTDDEGFYRFAHLQQGKYFVTVAAEPWYAQHTHPRNTASLSESETASMLEHPGAIYTIMKSVSAGAAEEDLSSLLDVAYPVTFYPGVTEFSAASVIVLEKGEKVSAEIHLRPVPALHLRVAFENPEQAQQSYAMLEQKMFDGTMVPVRSHSIQVAPGVMELVGIVPGHYTAKIQTLGSGDQPRLIQERELDVSQGGEIENSRVAAFAP